MRAATRLRRVYVLLAYPPVGRWAPHSPGGPRPVARGSASGRPGVRVRSPGGRRPVARGSASGRPGVAARSPGGPRPVTAGGRALAWGLGAWCALVGAGDGGDEGVDGILSWREGPGGGPRGGQAALDGFAGGPVLPVGQIPELHRVRRVEARS